METYDVGIVGAGVVGCAIARELGHKFSEKPVRIVVLEQRERAGEETSSRNSGVLHSGIHEHPSSLKARLAREGSALAVSYAVRHGIPLLRTGMVIAFSWQDVRRGLWREVATLRRLWANAWKSNIRVSLVTPRRLAAWEPNLRSCAGLVIPSVCVIDAPAFVQALRADAEATGAVFAFNNRVIDIGADSTSYLVTTDRKRIRTTCLINAAGLYADDIASLALHKEKYTLYPLRGEYYEVISPQKGNLVGRLVYPALPRQATGKGIHFSPRPNGQLFLGPNEVPVREKTDYTSHKTPPDMFVETLQKFLPVLNERDLRWAYSGIRPCVMTGNGRKSDFIVSVDKEDPPLINLIGIESPGLSAALALARHVTDLPCLRRCFGPPGSHHSSDTVYHR
jgi:glycerol-3-phosphate dehydrogenase